MLILLIFFRSEPRYSPRTLAQDTLLVGVNILQKNEIIIDQYLSILSLGGYAHAQLRRSKVVRRARLFDIFIVKCEHHESVLVIVSKGCDLMPPVWAPDLSYNMNTL